MCAASKKGGLGKGLEELFGEINNPVPVEKSEESSESLIYISIDDIKPNKMQPRRNFSEESIETLASSIREHGVIQPIMVRKSGRGYELIAGERRLRAAKKARTEKIPAIIKTPSDEENALFAIIENTQREDLNPVEEALAYKRIGEEFGFTQEVIAKSIGKSRPYVANTLRILKLPSEIIKLIEQEKLSAGHANAIALIKNEERQKQLAERVVNEGLSVRETEREASEKTKKVHKRASNKETSNTEFKEVERELETLFGTKIRISGTTERGIIGIHFFSRDELEGLLDSLRNLT